MGIVIKQSIRNLFTTYIGFVLGAINTLFLYVNFMSDMNYGLVGFLLSSAMILMPFMSIGVQNTIIKFYSGYREEERASFLSWILVLPLLVIIPVILVTYFFYDTIASWLASKNEIVYDYIWHIVLIAIAAAYFEIFYAWSKIHFRTVFGNFMKEVFHRVCITLLLILLAFEYVSIDQFFKGLVIIYVLRTVIMNLFSFTLKFPRITLSRKRPHNYKDVLKYAVLIVLAGSVASLLIDLDKVMLGLFKVINNVAYYSVAIYIATVIAVPVRAMHQITYPMVAQMLNEKKYDEMKSLYKKSSISLLVVAGLIFLLIVCNIQSLYALIDPKYSVAMYIVVIIGFAKLMDNALGVNNAIIYNSDYYRIVLFMGVALVIIAILLNILLIPMYGIYGAAIATLVASLCYGAFKLWIVQRKFNMQPFSISTIKLLLLFGVTVAIFFFWNISNSPFLSIVIKSTLLTILYTISIYKFSISEDINTVINKGLINRLKK